LRSKTVIHGIRWTLLTTILRRAISFVLFIFLAKWLSQADFGIYRSLSLILVIVTYFSNWGLDYHYLISTHKSRINLFVLLQIGLLSALGLAFLLMLTGRGIGYLYHSEVLGNILVWSGGYVIIEALRRVFRANAQKLLYFRELAIAETLNVLTYSVLCIVLIFFIREVWLFILLFYIGNLAELLYLGFKLPALPKAWIRRSFCFSRLRRSLGMMQQNSHFLLSVTVTNLVQIYSSNAPVLFLGTMVEPALMGIYFFATQLIAIPVGMLTTSISQVFFPILAKGDASANLAGIRRYTSLVLKIGIPALFAYALALQYLVPLIWNAKWLGSLPIIMYLVIFYGTSLLHHPISGIPFICRKPLWELGWNIVTLILRLAALAYGMREGYAYAVLLFCLVSAVMHLVFYFMSLQMLKANLKELTLYFLTHIPILLVFIGSSLYLQKFSTFYPALIVIMYIVYLAVAERESVKETLQLLKLRG
jgi:O-antigen/teichoic acid export membrane protein